MATARPLLPSSHHPRPLFSPEFAQFGGAGVRFRHPAMLERGRRASPVVAQLAPIDLGAVSSLFDVSTADVGYSQASYYTSLGLFVISVPGLWSLIKRSVKSKIVKKTFVKEERASAPNQIAGEILSFFTRNNFSVIARGETITYDGSEQRASCTAYILHLH